jgi:hypothetical protein
MVSIGLAGPGVAQPAIIRIQKRMPTAANRELILLNTVAFLSLCDRYCALTFRTDGSGDQAHPFSVKISGKRT